MPHRKRPRNTQQRKIILEELRKVTSHPTAADLYEIVRRRLPRISLGTVYRNLELLSRLGTIQKLAIGGAEARFDGNPDHHYHVRCVRCGRMDDLSGPFCEVILPPPERVDGYEILGHRLEYFGICAVCRSTPATHSEAPSAETGE